MNPHSHTHTHTDSYMMCSPFSTTISIDMIVCNCWNCNYMCHVAPCLPADLVAIALRAFCFPQIAKAENPSGFTQIPNVLIIHMKIGIIDIETIQSIATHNCMHFDCKQCCCGLFFWQTLKQESEKEMK